MDSIKTIRTPWDAVWKEALTQLLRPALELLFPRAAAEIDWTFPVEILDRELRTLVAGPLGRRGRHRFVDHLVRVRRLTGRVDTVLIHLEVQGTPQKDFEERIYLYHSWLTGVHGRLVATFAVLADGNPGWRPCEYRGDYLGGGSALLEFPTVKLIDLESSWESLITSDNPFGLFVAAHIKALRTRRFPDERLNWKSHLTEMLTQKEWDEHTLKLIFQFIDAIMILPKDRQRHFTQWAEHLQEERAVTFLSPTDRLRILDARQEGFQEGLCQQLRTSLYELAEVRFGACTPEVSALVQAASSHRELTALWDRMKRVETLSEFLQR